VVQSFVIFIPFGVGDRTQFQTSRPLANIHVVGNNMKRFSFILTMISVTVSCSVKPENIESVPVTNFIYQISSHHGQLERDSVQLLKSEDSNRFYDQIKIFRGQQLIFNHSDKDLEIIGTPKATFVEHDIETYSQYYYIFKIFEGESPESFLVIKTTKDQTSIFGKTDTNSADIFGDIDYDGKFEIGGWTDYCQEDESHKCPDLDLYTVFELGDNFPTDTTLTTFFRQLIKDR
jgi:hypothetical protein